MKKIFIILMTVVLSFMAFFAFKMITYTPAQISTNPIQISSNEISTKPIQIKVSRVLDNEGNEITEENGIKIEEIMPNIDPSMDGIDDEIEPSSPVTLQKQADFEKIKAKNSDVVGWISVPNTRIEYPVVLYADNDYYLNHNVEKKNSKAGAIFMDFRNADTQRRRHIIIYGHNMKSGSMFNTLASFKIRNFFEKNNILTFSLDGEAYEYEVFSAFVADANSGFIRTSFKNDNDFVAYMNGLKALSKFDSGATISPSDQILTLSTCTYETGDSRFVVQAKRRMK